MNYFWGQTSQECLQVSLIIGEECHRQVDDPFEMKSTSHKAIWEGGIQFYLFLNIIFESEQDGVGARIWVASQFQRPQFQH